MTILLAATFKTLLTTLVSQRVALNVFFLLAKWAASKSTTRIDDKIVAEIEKALIADGKLNG